MADSRDPLSVAFTELAVSVMPEVRLLGVEAARGTVRRRRRRRFALVAAAVAVVLLVPPTAFALLRTGGDAGPDIGNTSVPPPPTVTSTPPATGSPQPGVLRALRDGYEREQTPLDDALLEIPAFPGGHQCPAGETQYHGGVWQGPLIAQDQYVQSSIEHVATGDVNGDGALDWVAAFYCRYGLVQGTDGTQIVAFTRYGNGPYSLLGQIFVPDANYVASDPEVAADGAIRLIVTGPYESEHVTAEWRSFRWDGSGFGPVGSPVVIPAPAPTDLSVTTAPATVAGPSTVLSVTVHNGGTASYDYLQLSFSPSLLDGDAGRLTSISIRPDGFAADLRPHGDCQVTADCEWAVQLEPAPAGQAGTARFTVSIPGTITGGSLFVHVTGVARGYGFLPNATTGNGVRVPIAAR